MKRMQTGLLKRNSIHLTRELRLRISILASNKSQVRIAYFKPLGTLQAPGDVFFFVKKKEQL